MSNKGRDVSNNGAWTRDLHPHLTLPVADVHAYTNQMHQSEDHTSCERFSGSQRKSISAGVIEAPWGRHTLTNYLSLGACFHMRNINLFQPWFLYFHISQCYITLMNKNIVRFPVHSWSHLCSNIFHDKRQDLKAVSSSAPGMLFVSFICSTYQ
jgi:hypothetical protein